MNNIGKARETQICVVGGGPAGLTLGYLLGRSGIAALVLESQGDFDRDFRGDTLHAGVMEIFDSLALGDEILKRRHHKIRTLGAGGMELVDFSRLNTPFPYITMMAQSVFLDFLAKESARFPNFSIEMNAQARELKYDGESDRVSGLRYRKKGEIVDVRADLVVACDGRGSLIRRKSGLEIKPVTDPLEVLWFRLPRFPEDSQFGYSGVMTGGRAPFFVLERSDHYQIACVIKPGTYSKIRKEGLPEFHEEIGKANRDFLDRARESLTSWKDVAFLHVQGGRLSKWYRPGLLLIGDAAHVMTPIGGVGINYAIWDAVETANVLVPVLRSSRGGIEIAHLEEIQRRREPATRRMQLIQKLMGGKLLDFLSADSGKPFRLPFLAKLLFSIPGVRTLPSRMIALGGTRTKCEIGKYFEAPPSFE